MKTYGREMNKLATQICKIEGGKLNLTNAQVKEVLKCLCQLDKADRLEKQSNLTPGWPLKLLDDKISAETEKEIKKKRVK